VKDPTYQFPLEKLALDLTGVDLEDPYALNLICARIAVARGRAIMQTIADTAGDPMATRMTGARAHAMLDLAQTIEDTIEVHERLANEKKRQEVIAYGKATLEAMRRPAEAVVVAEREPVVVPEPEPEPEPEEPPLEFVDAIALDEPAIPTYELSETPFPTFSPPADGRTGREPAPAIVAAVPQGQVFDFKRPRKTAPPVKPPYVATYQAEFGDQSLQGVVPRYPDRPMRLSWREKVVS
jgi:hypothetical protein